MTKLGAIDKVRMLGEYGRLAPLFVHGVVLGWPKRMYMGKGNGEG